MSVEENLKNLSDYQLYLWVKEVDPVFRGNVIYQVQKNGNLNLALRIEKAVDVMLEEKIKKLNEAYYSGNVEEFLQKLSWTEKSELSMKMILLPKLDINLLRLLSESIDSKFLKELVERKSLLYSEV